MRRHHLMRELGTLVAEAEFHKAAPDDTRSAVAATELQTKIDETVIRTALREIKGLRIDGKLASVESLIASGPESLAREIAQAIAEESSLDENERKNSSSHSISIGRLQPDGIATPVEEKVWRQSETADGWEYRQQPSGPSCGLAVELSPTSAR